MGRSAKIMLIVFIVVILIVLTAGCRKTQNVSADAETQDAARHLLAVWHDYLDVLDRMYASELWAMDHVDAYLKSGDWSDLTKARTACIASARYLTQLSMTEEDLSEDEYLLLAGAGVDTGYQSMDFALVTDTLDRVHTIIRSRLLEGLEYDFFDKNLIEILREGILVQREYITNACLYICNETNYFLLSMRDMIDAGEEWSSMKERYPTLSVGCGQWIETEVELKALGDAYLDEYEDILLKQSELLSMMKADLYRMAQIVKNNDIEAIMEAVYPMSGVPDLLPRPAWYDPAQTGYLSLVVTEDNSVIYPESGDEMDDKKYSVYMKIEYLTREDIISYLQTAERYAELVWKAEEEETWYILMPDYYVSIEWQDGTVVILFKGEDVTFAPLWYIGLQ